MEESVPKTIIILAGLLSAVLLFSGLRPLEPARAADSGRKVLYWYDPMYPGTRFDQPGRSPFMDMDLVPRYADEAGSGSGVAIDPVQVQNLGLRTAPVRRGQLVYARDLPANVEFNGYQRARLQARAEGFVSAVQKISPGDFLEAGAVLASVTVPAWASDQSEYLLLKSQRADPKIIAGVREKLRLGGMPEEMLAGVDESGRVQTDLLIRSPLAGVVTALDLYQGMNIEKNMVLAEVQGLDPVWVTAEIPEQDLALAQGRVRVTAAAWPDRAFEVLSRTLLPQASSQTRTVPLRLTVANPQGFLKPGLTAAIRLRWSGPEGLIIPTQSLIDLGEEKSVITRRPDGTFLPKLVKTGGSAREDTLIAEGLEEGELVVVSGLFLIDSEASLRGALERLRSPEKEPPEAARPENGRPAPESAPPAPAPDPDPDPGPGPQAGSASPLTQPGAGS
jgi:Cu(I)/Ag(I) efflux system membrane fusion protein